MGRLHSNIFIAIVSLWICTGYGFELFGDCCSHHPSAQEAHEKSASDEQTPSQADGCECVCHQMIAPQIADSLREHELVLVPADFMSLRDEFPPDAVPLGIEVPPQLA